MTTDFLLWQWSLLAQLACGVMIAGFFLGFRRTTRTAAVRVWSEAWLANAASLMISVVDVYWIDSTSGPVFTAVCAAYLWTKTVCVLRLAEGIAIASNSGSPPWSRRTQVALASVIGAGGALAARNFIHLGLLAQAVVLIGASIGVRRSLRSQLPELGWLAVGLGLRATLAGCEVVAYSVEAWPILGGAPWLTDLMARLLAVSSSFDTLSEWLIALGCVLAATGRRHAEMRAANDDLRAAQDALRAVVNVDSLTGLANRRALADITAGVRDTAAALVFLDLHNFKEINDAHGHAVGDALLQRFAHALRESFRPEDTVVRYAGDEFVVVARGLSSDGVQQRISALRAHLVTPADGIPMHFDAGHAMLSPGDSADDALRAADLAMYEAKLLAKHVSIRD
jgi:diguanylate cyclase (GGDEF)-like protein